MIGNIRFIISKKAQLYTRYISANSLWPLMSNITYTL